MTKQKNYDRLVNKLTKGLDLTTRQKTTVKNQLMRGVETPRLTVAGLKLTLEEIGMTKRLLLEYEEAGRVRKDTGARAYLQWKGRDYTTTSEGVTVTKQEVKELRSQIRKINESIKKQQFRDTALNVIANERISTPETHFYPARAREQTGRYRTFTLKGIHSQADWERFKQDIASRTPGASGLSDYSLHIFDVEKSNWIRAARKQWGRGSYKILKVVKQFTPEDFHDLISEELLPTVGQIYDAIGDRIPELKKELLERLPELSNRADKLYRDTDYEDIGL